MNDMRFFHYFIVKGYPHLPLNADHVWTMEVPAIAYKVSALPLLLDAYAYFRSTTTS
jgi:hypothetical protein